MNTKEENEAKLQKFKSNIVDAAIEYMQETGFIINSVQMVYENPYKEYVSLVRCNVSFSDK